MKPCRGPQGHANMTRHINNASSLIAVSLYQPKVAAFGRLCSFQAVPDLLTHRHTHTGVHCDGTHKDTLLLTSVQLCCESWLTVSAVSPLFSFPFLPSCRLPAGGGAHPHLQLLSGDQGAEPWQEAGGAHLLCWLRQQRWVVVGIAGYVFDTTVSQWNRLDPRNISVTGKRNDPPESWELGFTQCSHKHTQPTGKNRKSSSWAVSKRKTQCLTKISSSWKWSSQKQTKQCLNRNINCWI